MRPALLCVLFALIAPSALAQGYRLVPTPQSEAAARDRFFRTFPDGIPLNRPFNGGWYWTGGGDPAAFDFLRQFQGKPIGQNSY